MRTRATGIGLAAALLLLAAGPAGAATTFPTAKKPSLLGGQARARPRPLGADGDRGRHERRRVPQHRRRQDLPRSRAGRERDLRGRRPGEREGPVRGVGQSPSRARRIGARPGRRWGRWCRRARRGRRPITSLDAAGPILVAGTDVAVFQSDDGGATWTRVGPDSRTGLEGVPRRDARAGQPHPLDGQRHARHQHPGVQRLLVPVRRGAARQPLRGWQRRRAGGPPTSRSPVARARRSSCPSAASTTR